MSARRRAHVADYELGEDGSYTYTGAYWRWAEPAQRLGTVGFAWGLWGGAAACVVGAGLVPDPGINGAAYVLLPYVAAVVGLALAASALWALSREGERLRDHVYQRSVVTLPARLTVGCVAALASGGGCLVHGVLGGQMGWPTLLFGTLVVGAGISMGQLAARLRRVGFVREDA